MVVFDTRKPKPKFINPETVVSGLAIESGQTVIDLGSAVGFWSIPIAKKVGSKGSVYVVGKIPERLEVVKRRAELAHLSNIKVVLRTDAEAIGTKVQADWVIVSNLLSRLNHHEDFFEQLATRSKVGTQVLVTDWLNPKGFKASKTLRSIEDVVIYLAARAGFKFSHTVDAGTFHYGLLFCYTGDKFHARKK